jgi:hypothetical protein
MEKVLESSQKKKEMDPITMDDEHIREIIRNAGVRHIERPYQYNMNNKKMVLVE